MVSAVALFQPGWIHRQHIDAAGEDPLTGNPLPPRWVQHPGRGLLQAPLWTGFVEISVQSSRDERLALFTPDEGPPRDISQEDVLIDPEGRTWLCITDGMPRGIPGQVPEYIAIRVRRAKESDR